MKHIASSVFMVKPNTFGFNEETAMTNSFQNKNPQISSSEIRTAALREFDECANLLNKNNIKTFIYQHGENQNLPDAVFPNNWFCHLSDQQLVLFPMLNKSRRKEKIPEFDQWLIHHGIKVSNVIDLQHWENENAFLEGTGSLILDHKNKKAWAALSGRTSYQVAAQFSGLTSYQLHCYETIPFKGALVYHTNVIQAISPNLMIVTQDIIHERDLSKLISSIEEDGRLILNISLNQMEQFCGNLLFLQNEKGIPFWVMSQTAYQAFNNEQKKQLSSEGELLIFNIHQIEKTGGGSARCMLAEIF